MFSKKVSGLYEKVQAAQITALQDRIFYYDSVGVRSIDYVALYEDLVRAKKLAAEFECDVDVDLDEFEPLTLTYTLDAEFLSKALHKLKELVEVLYVCSSKSANGRNGG